MDIKISKNKKNIKAKSNILSLIIAVIITISMITAFRLFVHGDLLNISFQGLSGFKSLSVVIAIALLPAFAIIFLFVIVDKWVIRKKNHIVKTLTRFLTGILVFAWGFASSRPSLHFKSEIVQGILGLIIFYSTYNIGQKFFGNKININLQRVTAVLILVLWGIYTAFIVSKDRDYLNSPLPVMFAQTNHRPSNIIVLGIDGMDWKITNDFINAGYLPSIKSLMDRGSYAPLHTIRPTSSPFIWNAIFTGFMPEIHQLRPSVIVLPFNTIYKRNHSGLPDLIQIAAPFLFPSNKEITHYPLAFWDILRRIGYATAVIGNWEHEPLSSRGQVNFPDLVYPAHDLGVLDLKDAHLSEDIEEFARSINIPPDQIPRDEWSFFTISGDLPSGLFESISKNSDQPELLRLARFRQMYATDRFRFLLAERILRSLPQPYCMFLYSHGIDLISHCYLHLYERHGVSERELQYEQIVQQYYKKVDQWVGQVISSLPSNTVIILLSDHGFDLNFYIKHPYKTRFHFYAPHGIFIAVGPKISHRKLDSIHVLDIAPSILSIARAPELANMQGVSFLVEEQNYNITVSDWWMMEKTYFNLGDPKLLDKKTIEKLKSLGYIK